MVIGIAQPISIGTSGPKMFLEKLGNMRWVMIGL